MVEMFLSALVGIGFFVAVFIACVTFEIYLGIAGRILEGVIDSINNDVMRWLVVVPTIILLATPLLYGVVWSLSVVGDGVISKIRGPQQIFVQTVQPTQAEKK